jgi:hypothetical protein
LDFIEMLLEDPADFQDCSGMAMHAGMIRRYDQFRFHIVHMGALVGDDPVGSFGQFAVKPFFRHKPNNRMVFDPGSALGVDHGFKYWVIGGKGIYTGSDFEDPIIFEQMFIIPVKGLLTLQHQRGQLNQLPKNPLRSIVGKLAPPVGGGNGNDPPH